MGLESSFNTIADLNAAWPTAADPKSAGDDHIRGTKNVLKMTFANVTAAVTASHTELNYVTGVTSSIQGQFAAMSLAKGAIAGQVWTGVHDFTGATLKSALPAVAADVVNKQYADALSFTAALPSQTGNAGKFVTTNGTVASWAVHTFLSTTPVVKDATDPTKQVAIAASGITTATTRTWTSQDRNGTVAYLDDTGIALIAVLTPTASATVDFSNVFTSTYDDYLILLDAILPSASDGLTMRYFVAGSIDSTTKYNQIGFGGGTTTPGGQTAHFINSNQADSGVNASTGNSQAITIFGANETARPKIASCAMTIHAQGTNIVASQITGHYIGTAAVSGVRFYWNGGANFVASGKIRIYGYKKA